MANGLGILKPVLTGIKHIFFKRITRRFPELEGTGLPESYYSYDPKKGIALPGWKGRHFLEMDKCTGCQLCGIMCDEIASAIIMVEVPDAKYPTNKKSLFPAVDYGRCVFCGLCIDACPFECFHMTPDVQLADYDRKNLIYMPKELNIPTKVGLPTYVVGKKVVQRSGAAAATASPSR